MIAWGGTWHKWMRWWNNARQKMGGGKKREQKRQGHGERTRQWRRSIFSQRTSDTHIHTEWKGHSPVEYSVNGRKNGFRNLYSVELHWKKRLRKMDLCKWEQGLQPHWHSTAGAKATKPNGSMARWTASERSSTASFCNRDSDYEEQLKLRLSDTLRWLSAVFLCSLSSHSTLSLSKKKNLHGFKRRLNFAHGFSQWTVHYMLLQIENLGLSTSVSYIKCLIFAIRLS